MITQNTIIDKIEIDRYGVIQIRFGLQLLENGVELAVNWHRTSIPPGTSPDEQMNLVNEHLNSLGRKIVEQPEINKIKSFVSLVHTPDVIAAAKARKVGVV